MRRPAPTEPANNSRYIFVGTPNVIPWWGGGFRGIGSGCTDFRRKNGGVRKMDFYPTTTTTRAIDDGAPPMTTRRFGRRSHPKAGVSQLGNRGRTDSISAEPTSSAGNGGWPGLPLVRTGGNTTEPMSLSRHNATRTTPHEGSDPTHGTAGRSLKTVV